MNRGVGRVRVSPGFLLLAAWLLYWDSQGIVPAALLACCLHEAGHLLLIRLAKGTIKEFNLTAIGAELKLGEPLSYGWELAAAAAGPGVNLLLTALFHRVWPLFAGINLALAAFNLLPLSRLDGGRIRRCGLSVVIDPDRADAAGRRLDLALAGLLLVLGCWAAWRGGNLTLLLVSLWLCCGSGRDFREKGLS